MKLELKLPTTNTTLEIAISDRKPSELIDDLYVLITIIQAIQSDCCVRNEHRDYVVGIAGEHDFFTSGVKHKEWNGECDDEECNSECDDCDIFWRCLITERMIIEGNTYYYIPKSIGDIIKKDKVIYKSIRSHIKKMKKKEEESE